MSEQFRKSFGLKDIDNALKKVNSAQSVSTQS